MLLVATENCVILPLLEVFCHRINQVTGVSHLLIEKTLLVMAIQLVIFPFHFGSVYAVFVLFLVRYLVDMFSKTQKEFK